MACPTHSQYDYGAVLGEVLDQYVVDLLADKPTPTGEVDGQAGTCRSVEVHLHPQGDQGLRLGSGADAAAMLEGNSILLEGTQAWTALVQAVRNRYAYRVEWSKK